MEYPKTIGILGGMGPAATVDFFGKIVAAAQVGCDQDHPRIIIDCNPKIPDRTTAILKNGTAPLPEMLQSLRRLENSRVDLITIPCVTAHFFHARLQEQTSIPILHIVRETIRHLAAHYPQVRTVGAIATSGTLQSGLIANICAEYGIELLIPEASIQTDKVMAAIYRIKAEGASEASASLVREAAGTLIGQGAQAIIAGCTEIPLVLRDGDIAVPVLDPISILAERALAEAL